MRILLVSSFLPYPLFSGGHVRLYNLIKGLKKRGHLITLVCEKREYQTEENLEEVKKICEQVICVDRIKQWSPGTIIKTAFSFYPFLLTGHTQKIMKDKIYDLLQKEKFNLIHVETFYVMQNLPQTDIPVVLVEHNIEYLVYKRYMQSSPIFLRWLLAFDIEKIKYWEKHFWKKAKRVVAVSKEEKNLINRKNIDVVPNGVDINKFKIKNLELRIGSKEKKILFIGDFKWIQNRDAAGWLIEEIWQTIKSKIKNQKSKMSLKLWIVGRKIPDSIKNLNSDKDIIFDENAPSETEEIFQKADVLIAPIRVGGGTSYKILEAMASGVVVVTTPLGIEGVDAKDDEDVLIGKNASELADKTVDILGNEDKFKKIASSARLLIEQKYDWEIIVKNLEDIYKKAVAS